MEFWSKISELPTNPCKNIAITANIPVGTVKNKLANMLTLGNVAGDVVPWRRFLRFSYILWSQTEARNYILLSLDG